MSHNVSNFDEDLAVIQTLDDEPNDVDGLSAQQLKAKFDQAALLIQKFINEVLIPSHNALDKDVNQRIDEVIEELKNVSEINAENLGAQNIALDKKGETTLAGQYNTGELAPTVHGALRRILEMFLRKCGDTMTGPLKFEIPNMSYFAVSATAEGAIISVYKEWAKRRYLYIPDETAPSSRTDPQFVDYEHDLRHTLLHTGNLEALNMAKAFKGEYTGTGDTTKTLTFPFAPKFVYVASEEARVYYGRVLAINGMTSVWNSEKDTQTTTKDCLATLSWGEKSLTLSSATQGGAMNTTGATYHYIAIG